MSEQLADALIEAMVMLSDSGENIDPDFSTQALQVLVRLIDDMGDEERNALREIAIRKAASETVPERKEFFTEFPDAFGLVEDRP
jgi:hypothetical protein